jgi:two-component system nitrate/nitrite response regulator NarL
MSNTKVLLIDAQELSREGLKLLLHSDSYDVIGATRSLDEARAAVAEGLQPDLVLFLLDHLGESEGDATLPQIRAGFAAFKFVVIAAKASPSLSARCLDAGVNGCLVGDMSTSALTRSLRLIMLGHEIFPAPAGVLPMEPTSHAPRELGQGAAAPGPSKSLSGGEGQILRKLLLGHSNKMIARELAISENTVKVHLKGLLRKLKARNRTQAAIWAMGNGFAMPSTDAPHSFADTASYAPRPSRLGGVCRY